MLFRSKYSTALYNLLIGSLHLDVNNAYAYLVEDVDSGDNVVKILDTPTNRENFIDSVSSDNPTVYMVDDNIGGLCGCYHMSATNIAFVNGNIEFTLNNTLCRDYKVSEFARFVRLGEYIYDSRVDNITYGVTSKGSGEIRAAKLSWFGKKVNELTFAQPSKNI